MTVTINIPDEIEAQLKAAWTDIPRHALEGLLAEAFGAGKISSGQVAQALGMRSRWEAIEFLSARGVYPGYGHDELAQDMASIDKLSRLSDR